VVTTLCSEVRASLRPIIIQHASRDPVYCDHPTPKLYGFESYVAVPIFRRSGEYFGNVCGLDPLPIDLDTSKTLAMLHLFSELISFQLDAEERHEQHRLELESERTVARLREEFIAVLGHDVRNPLWAILAGSEHLLVEATDTQRRMLERIRGSARRINGLVDDLLDLARGRMGGGISLDWIEVDDLDTRVRHVASELQGSHPTRPIRVDTEIIGSVRCDPRRVEQLVSNLLGNAVQHGLPNTPITLSVRGQGAALHIQVRNRGEPIGEAVMRQLFQPYFRGGQSRSQGGLGLGLFIVQEIAKSHGGRVSVNADEGWVTFTFEMG
jgi:signal transduction histidine kinase